MTGAIWEMARKRGTEGKIGQINPLKRGGVSDEIARVVLFLGSDEFVLLSLFFLFFFSPSPYLPRAKTLESAMPLQLSPETLQQQKRLPNANRNYRSSYVNAQFWAVDGGLSGSHPTMPGKFY